MKKKVMVVDIGSGNFGSLKSAFNKLNIPFKVCKSVNDFEDTSKIILPGMGSFPNFMNGLRKLGFEDLLKKNLLSKKSSILGICVGYQALFSQSEEIQITKGLNFIDGKIKKLSNNKKIKLPHIGWNQCTETEKNTLFHEIPDKSDFYFCHSYAPTDLSSNYKITNTKYGENFSSSICHNNIYGVQFHPEKSQINGLKILKNFYENV